MSSKAKEAQRFLESHRSRVVPGDWFKKDAIVVEINYDHEADFKVIRLFMHPHSGAEYEELGKIRCNFSAVWNEEDRAEKIVEFKEKIKRIVGRKRVYLDESVYSRLTAAIIP